MSSSLDERFGTIITDTKPEIIANAPRIANSNRQALQAQSSAVTKRVHDTCS